MEYENQQGNGVRTGGQILVDQLIVNGCNHVFLVPGESFLAVLDALYDANIRKTVCRQEGGAAMMAEAYGKLTGRPGVCFVTRGPGATNAAAGVHVAQQDSTPLILFVGQIESTSKGRDAFQELDYHAVFGSMAKMVFEINEVERIPEIVSRAYSVAMSGRPGPVVIALPENMLVQLGHAGKNQPARLPINAYSPQHSHLVADNIANSNTPLVVVGGSTWQSSDFELLIEFSEKYNLPVATSFRRQSLFPTTHKNYAGHFSTTCSPYLSNYAKNSDLLILIGTRFSEIASQNYTIINPSNPEKTIVHVHPGAGELNRVYRADTAIVCHPGDFLSTMLQVDYTGDSRINLVAEVNAHAKKWMEISVEDYPFSIAEVIRWLNEKLPNDAIICNGAGNYATWIHRFKHFSQPQTQLAPTSGSMGYGVPAAIAAKTLYPEKDVIAFAGDGCFMMHGQEFMTAVQYNLPIIVVVLDNSMYGTIRMHQEMQYPGRVCSTYISSPDFAALAEAYGGYGEYVEFSADFPGAFERAIKSNKPAIIHCAVDSENIAIDHTISSIRKLSVAND